MKKNLIALSVAAMVGGLAFSTGARADVVSAGATTTGLEFTQDGIGHALIVPYFTVQNGNMTVFHVINTDTLNGKAVKVRFRGASNSDDVFDFQVYMSPGDVFTGAVTQDASGVAKFSTADTTCTIPASVNQNFVTSRLSADEQVAGAGTREGYIEIFNMADIPKYESAAAAAAGGDGIATFRDADINGDADFADVSALWTAIKHVDGVPPCGLTTNTRLAALLSTNTDAVTTGAPLDAAQAGTVTASAYVKGFNHPTATLMGGSYIINVDEALSYSSNDTTIVATGGNGRGNIVFWPQRDFTIGTSTNAALLADASLAGNTNFANYFTADPLLKLGGTAAGKAVGGVEPRAYDLPDMSTPYFPGSLPWDQAASLSGALAVSSILNEYATDAIISAASDWTFTMPSRRYNAAVRYSNGTSGSGAPAAIYTDLQDGQYSDIVGATLGATAPYVAAAAADALYEILWVETPGSVALDPGEYDDANNFFSPTNTELVGTQLCVSGIGVSYTDREEGAIASPTIDFVISPSTPASTPAVLFCGEASVLKFNVANTAPSVLGAALATQGIEVIFNEAGDTYTNGWATLTTPGLSGNGLPIVGSYFLKAVNPSTAAGVAANYGISFAHRVTR